MLRLFTKRIFSHPKFIQSLYSFSISRWFSNNTVDSTLADKVRQKAQKQKLVEQRRIIASLSDNEKNVRPDLAELVELEKLEEKARITPLKHILEDEELHFVARLLKLCASTKPNVRFKSVKMLALLEPPNNLEISPVYNLIEQQFQSSIENDEFTKIMPTILKSIYDFYTVRMDLIFRALRLHELSQSFIDKSYGKSSIQALSNLKRIANLYVLESKLNDAEKVLKDGISRFENVETSDSIQKEKSNFLCTIAQVYHQMQNLFEAKEFYSKALSIYSDSWNDQISFQNKLKCLVGIADIEVKNKQFAIAKPILEDALKLFSSIQLADVDNIKDHAQVLLQQCNKVQKI